MTKLLIFLTAITTTSCIDIDGYIKLDDERFQKCADESGYQPDEEVPLTLNDAPTLELLCLMKCMAETLEILDQQGNISQENIVEFEKNLPEEQHSMFTACVKDSPKIETCQDMDYFVQCLTSLL